LTTQLYYYTLSGYLIASFDGTTTTYYLTDALGSVLMSFSKNAILGEQIYGPYGNQRYTAGTINTAKGYTGQIQDSVTGPGGRARFLRGFGIGAWATGRGQAVVPTMVTGRVGQARWPREMRHSENESCSFYAKISGIKPLPYHSRDGCLPASCTPPY